MKLRLFACLPLAYLSILNAPFSTALAQNIAATVAPNISGSDNYVDIQNNSGGDWYFFSNAVPAAAQMSRISGLTEFVWPSVGNFQPDPVNLEDNRIYQGEYLRVYPQTLAANTVIQVVFSYTPVGTRYDFNVTVTAGAQVTALNILDASPTSAATVHWGVSFSQAVSGVTAANFAFNNPDSISGLTITSVTPNTTAPSANWTVTASTGTGTGILGLNWAGHQSESPTVPNSFVGEYYDFSQYPIISQYPTNVGINVNSTTTMSVVASLRGGGTPNYQWYSGTSVNPNAATAISGATGSSYTPPTFTGVGSYQYFCRVYTTVAYYTDSTTATVTVVVPPLLTSSPQNVTIATGQTATFAVTATGTSLSYQWYNGVFPDTSNPVAGYSASYTTPALPANTSYWAQVYNAGPTVANSATAAATVVTTLAPVAGIYEATVGQLFPAVFTVTARDSSNNPVANLPVTFTAPGGSGPGGTFQGGVTNVTENTSTGGAAKAPVFTANEVPGVFIVTANYATLTNTLFGTNDYLLASKVVTTDADSGSGSLRAILGLYPPGSAIMDITFAANLSGSTITLTNGELMVSNSATIDASSLPAGIAISGGNSSRAFYISPGVTNIFNDLTMTGGVASTGPLVGYGGAIFIDGALTLNNCALTNNSASVAGGGLYTRHSEGVAILNNCTLSGNSTSYGGGVQNEGTLVANNSTFSLNTASVEGGAISTPFGAPAFFNQCTLAGNSSAQGGGIYIASGGMTISNSIVAGNIAGTGSNISGAFTALGANITNINPLLAPLGNYGGPTQTMPPLPGSPAIDACASTGLATDQRGFPRPVAGLEPDIGAVDGVYNAAGPGLSGSLRLGNGGIQFTFTNPADASFTVFASTNLAAPLALWSNLGPALALPPTYGVFQFTDPQAANYAQRFYLLRSP